MPRAVHTQKKRFPGQEHWAVLLWNSRAEVIFLITRQNVIGRENIGSPRVLLSYKQKFKHTTSGSLPFLTLREFAVHGGCSHPARESEVFSAELILTLCLVMTSRLELAYFCGDALGAPSSRGWYKVPLRATQSLLCYWIWLWWVKAPRMLVKEKEKKIDLKFLNLYPNLREGNLWWGWQFSKERHINNVGEGPALPWHPALLRTQPCDTNMSLSSVILQNDQIVLSIRTYHSVMSKAWKMV